MVINENKLEVKKNYGILNIFFLCRKEAKMPEELLKVRK